METQLANFAVLLRGFAASVEALASTTTTKLAAAPGIQAPTREAPSVACITTTPTTPANGGNAGYYNRFENDEFGSTIPASLHFSSGDEIDCSTGISHWDYRNAESSTMESSTTLDFNDVGLPQKKKQRVLPQLLNSFPFVLSFLNAGGPRWLLPLSQRW
jgi:hypothetical protein